MFNVFINFNTFILYIHSFCLAINFFMPQVCAVNFYYWDTSSLLTKLLLYVELMTDPEVLSDS